jgi:transposase
MEANNFELIIKRGCGIDVHEKNVVVTIRGDGIGVETRTFLTFTEDLGELLCWLKSKEVTHGAMESTGVYWKPVYNILSESLNLILVNARHMKNVPGRKTDKVDSAWICKLLMSGLLNASFIPEQQTRELRDMNRYGIKLTQDLASEKNRLHKILEDANIKLSSVVSDIDGVVASKLIAGLVEGKASIKELVAANYHKKMKASKADLEKALIGKVTAHHRFMLRQIYAHMAYLESQIMLIDNQIKEVLSADEALLTLLTEIPGVGLKSAIQIVSEVGTDLSKFATEKHFAKWAGMAPGNNESAGKKKVDASPMVINTSKRHFVNAVGQPVEQKILITEPNTIV